MTRMTISAAQLSAMRSSIPLPDTCIIKSPSYPGDSSYGWGTVTYTAVASGTVNCRLDPLGQSSSNQLVFDGREEMHIRYQLTVPYDAPIDSDYVVVTGGNTYQVVQIEAEHSWNVSRRAIVERVE